LIADGQVQLVRDMLLAARNAVAFVEDFSEAEFLADEKTQYAAIMCLHIVGETANRLTEKHPEFVSAHPELPFAEMRGMRNRIAHGYFSINLNVVWQTLKSDLPNLLDNLEAI
jgi:uncharacterized protein with HEPN domain